MIRIHDFLGEVRSRRVAINCIGDAMLDEYYNVQVNRISPEFPMPIMSSKLGEFPTYRPGGAANVIHQLKHYNCKAFLSAPLDLSSAEIFYRLGVVMDGSLLMDQDTPGHIPLKRRFLHEGIQVNRWDIEYDCYGLDAETMSGIRKKIKSNLPPADVTIFSDYGKGLFKVPDDFWIKDVPGITIVDPKNAPLERWKGCTIFKPNAVEAKELSGLRRPEEQCRYFHDQIGCRHVVVTNGSKGVYGTWDGDFFTYENEDQVKAVSVVGAGDCFVAHLALAVAHGREGADAAGIAFEAGQIYVQNNMNRPIVPAELIRSKIVDAEDLLKRDFKLVFTNGCFDILHEGHLHTLRFAKSQGDKLVVAVNADRSVALLKGGNRPIMSQEQRMEILAALDMVDFVVMFYEDTPQECLERCRPDILVKGGDYKPEDVVGKDVVRKVVIAPYLKGISTTEILKRC